MRQIGTLSGRGTLSPLRLFLLLAASIFVTESATMFFLSFLTNIPHLVEMLIDASVLVIFVSPVLYFFFYRPFSEALATSKKMAEEIIHLSDIPDDDPDPILEINLLTQQVSYLNKSAREHFPELAKSAPDGRGAKVDWEHPLFSGVKSMAEEFMLDDEAKALDIMEAVLNDENSENYRVYDRKLRYLPQQKILRIYTVNITRQEKLTVAAQQLLLEVERVKTALENEHKEAEEIGKTLLKSGPPPGLSASIQIVPCSKAGGDRAGFITRVAPGGDEEWLAVFDASGHGNGAAKFQEVAIGGLLALMNMGGTMGEALKTVNKTLERLGTGRFLVGNVFRIMREGERHAEKGFKVVEEFNIAQHGVIALDPDEGAAADWEWERNASRDAAFPIGLFADGLNELKPKYRSVKTGARIIAFTDGISEAANPGGQQFGRDRLKRIVLESRNLPPDQAHMEIVRAVKCWVGDLSENAPDEILDAVAMNDDLTLAIVDVGEP